ncbi:MAG: hypothetical protein ACE5IO_09060, partial [Thermoplasmata archaeon]
MLRTSRVAETASAAPSAFFMCSLFLKRMEEASSLSGGRFYYVGRIIEKPQIGHAAGLLYWIWYKRRTVQRLFRCKNLLPNI